MSKPPRYLPPETGRRAIGSNWKPVCRYCKQTITNPRRSSFCDDNCVVEFMVRKDPKFARTYVLERDGGICKKCNLDTSLFKEVYETALFLAESEGEADLIRDRLKMLGFHPNRSIYEVDHILEIRECEDSSMNGVDFRAPENLQLLCYRCHLEKSKLTKARLDSERKEKTCEPQK